MEASLIHLGLTPGNAACIFKIQVFFSPVLFYHSLVSNHHVDKKNTTIRTDGGGDSHDDLLTCQPNDKKDEQA